MIRCTTRHGASLVMATHLTDSEANEIVCDSFASELDAWRKVARRSAVRSELEVSDIYGERFEVPLFSRCKALSNGRKRHAHKCTRSKCRGGIWMAAVGSLVPCVLQAQMPLRVAHEETEIELMAYAE